MKHSANCFSEKIMSIYKTDLEINILQYKFDGPGFKFLVILHGMP